MLIHLSKRVLTTLTTRMICQYIEVKEAAMSQASPISVMGNHATKMMTVSAVAAGISSPSRLKDAYHSLRTNSAHDS